MWIKVNSPALHLLSASSERFCRGLYRRLSRGPGEVLLRAGGYWRKNSSKISMLINRFSGPKTVREEPVALVLAAVRIPVSRCRQKLDHGRNSSIQGVR